MSVRVYRWLWVFSGIYGSMSLGVYGCLGMFVDIYEYLWMAMVGYA